MGRVLPKESPAGGSEIRIDEDVREGLADLRKIHEVTSPPEVERQAVREIEKSFDFELNPSQLAFLASRLALPADKDEELYWSLVEPTLDGVKKLGKRFEADWREASGEDPDRRPPEVVLVGSRGLRFVGVRPRRRTAGDLMLFDFIEKSRKHLSVVEFAEREGKLLREKIRHRERREISVPTDDEVKAFRPSLVGEDVEALGPASVRIRLRARHKKFGDGTIVAELDGKYTIDFADGRRVLAKNFVEVIQD